MNRLTQLKQNVLLACQIERFDWSLKDHRNRHARHILIWAEYSQLGMKKKEILEKMEAPNASAITYAVRKIEYILKLNPSFKEKINKGLSKDSITKIFEKCCAYHANYNSILGKSMKIYPKISKPVSEQTGTKLRNCLKCKKEFFASYNPITRAGDRLCNKCKDTQDWRSGTSLSVRSHY